jgi:hypothetical protein
MMRKHIFPAAAILAFTTLGAVSGCTYTPPPPDVAAQQHIFQTGCQGQDATGYERLKAYCGGGEGGGGKN